MRHLITLLLLGAFSLGLLAHSSLTASLPARGQLLEESPAQIELTFSEKVRLMQLELRGENDWTLDLDLDGQPSSESQFEVPLREAIESGSYLLRWTIMSRDGHVMSGEIPFGLSMP